MVSKRMVNLLLGSTIIAAMLLAACQPQVIEVEKEIVVEKIVEKVVEVEVEAAPEIAYIEVEVEKEVFVQEVVEVEKVVEVQIGSDCTLGESPMLTAMVDAGELPGVCDRVPSEPFVFGMGTAFASGSLEPEIGAYGGEMVYTWAINTDIREYLIQTQNRAPVIVGGNCAYGSIAKSFCWNEDYTVFTVELREGHKWSDGVPMTSADVVYAFEVMNTPELYASVPNMFRTGATGDGDPLVVEAIDETTFTWTASSNYAALPTLLGNLGTGYTDFIKPQHYLEQFHQDTGDADEIAALLEEAELSEWYELFNLKDIRGWNSNSRNAIGWPTLSPWYRIESPDEKYEVVRNPYYYWIDTAGNQLPYMDKHVTVDTLWSTPETAHLMMFDGTADIMMMVGLSDYPLFVDESEKNGKFSYAIYPNKDSRGFYLNHTHEDPGWGETLADLRFRQAIAYSIDYAEINEEIYMNSASIPKMLPGEYAPEKAIALLDEMGMTALDADGYRLAITGDPFEIFIQTGPWDGYYEQAPFYCSYFNAVGLACNYKEVADIGERDSANENKGRINWNTGPEWSSHSGWVDYLPTTLSAPLWDTWYKDNTAGEEPPDWVKEIYAIHEGLASVAFGTTEYVELAAQRDTWIYDNLLFWGLVDQPGIAWFFDTCISNIPDTQTYHHGMAPAFRTIFWEPGCTN